MLIVAIYMVGCKTPQPIVTETNTNTLIEREQVDSLIKVATDQARAQLALECDSLGNVHIRELNMLQGERTRLEVALRAALDAAQSSQSGKSATPSKPTVVYLDIDCKADSLQILVTKLREHIKEIENSNKTETVEVKVVPDYYKNTSRGFWVLLAVLLVLVGWKAVKIYLKYQSGGIL